LNYGTSEIIVIASAKREAIQEPQHYFLDCFASLAMTSFVIQSIMENVISTKDLP